MPKARSTRLNKRVRKLFNNMVILSRAFWVQDGFQCDEHIVNRNEHETVSAKQIRIVVFESVGVSPEGLSRTSVVQLQAGVRNVEACLYNMPQSERMLFQARFTKSRRSLSEARERTSVRDRAERMLQRRVREAGAERALGYMTKRLSAHGGCLGGRRR